MFILRLESSREICEEAQTQVRTRKKQDISISLANSFFEKHYWYLHDLTSSELSWGVLQRSKADRRLRVVVLS